MSREKYAIIVAAGSGKRMGTSVPKQFLEIDGKPILMRTIEAFSHIKNIIVVLNPDYTDYWRELCQKYNFTIAHTVVSGGAERFHSVKNALATVPDNAVVAIHDGVRPYVSRTVIDEAFDRADATGTAVPVIDCVDSVRIITPNGNKPFPRSNVKLIQTPQVFDAAVLKKAYGAEYSPEFTDDASVVEKAGYKITLTHGNVENKKITFKTDIE